MASLLSSYACLFNPLRAAGNPDTVPRRSLAPSCYHSGIRASVAASSSSSSSSSYSSNSQSPASPPSSGQLAALAAAAAFLVMSSCPVAAADSAAAAFRQYFGTAASASSYGGYGGNASKRDTAEYVYDVPEGWKERRISKVEKGTNGTDSEFYNPRRKSERVYLTFLPGFRRLASRDTVLGNLALSDVNLQDIIASADSIQAADRTDPASGQLYYDFEVDSPVAHSLISVTCAKNKLYAHFVNAPSLDWPKDAPMLRHIHQSFVTVGGAPLEAVL